MQLVLIGGAQRSGTTLLQTLLASALDSPNLPEAHILSDILAAYKRAKEFSKKTRFFYATSNDLRNFFDTFAQRHLADVVVSTNPGAVLVLKDPNFVQVLDELSDLLPHCLRIVCVRDPRDIAASFVQIGQRQDDPSAGRYKKRDISFISKKILASYQPLMDAGEPPNTWIVRYEELASDPKRSLQALARDTGLELSLELVQHPTWLEGQARHEASWVTELEGGKPSPSSIGSFVRVLREEEIAVVQRICEPIMIRFGYAPMVESVPRRRDQVLEFFGLRGARSRKH